MDTLLNVLEAKSNEKHSDVATCMDSLVPQLISSVVTASLNGSDKQIVLQDDVLIKIALIIMIVYENVKARYNSYSLQKRHLNQETNEPF